MTPGDFGVVIGCKVTEISHTWLAQCFAVHSHIYHGFMGKSTLTHFPLEPMCEDYSFLDLGVEDFEHGLDSILTNYINTPELGTSFDEGDVMPSLVSSECVCLVSTHSDNSRL